jgi:ligand-binding sensor domain-containing protein
MSIKLIIYIIIIICLTFCNVRAFAQNTVIKHYGVNQGLPSSETYFVTQDSKGYLWIATDAGVVK